MEEKIPQIEYADRTATQKEGIRKLRVGIYIKRRKTHKSSACGM